MAIVCIKVSPVPPDFEMATNWVVLSGSPFSAFSKVTGSRLSKKCIRGFVLRRKVRKYRSRRAVRAPGRRGSIRLYPEMRCRLPSSAWKRFFSARECRRFFRADAGAARSHRHVPYAVSQERTKYGPASARTRRREPLRCCHFSAHV